VRLKAFWRPVAGSLLAAFLLASSSGCAPACTAVGCFNAVRIEFDAAIPWETTKHSVLLCIGTECLKAAGTPDEWQNATGTLGGRLFLSGPDSQLLQWEDGLQRSLQLDEEVTLDVVNIETGAQIVNGTWQPRWDVFRPNGARCPGVCYSTSLDSS
jgi:hypothetical protein